MVTIPTVPLRDGVAFPQLGLGTYNLRGAEGVDAIVSATAVGYRLLDSAVNYENEREVGEAVRRSDVDRDELIVTTKVPGRDHGYQETLDSAAGSLERLGLDRIDLYLIHWPNPITDRYVEAWTALIEAQQRGLVRSIGVCNFLPEHLDRLQRETGVLPAVNQVELHPYFPQAEQLAYDAGHGILTESWSPLGRGNDLLNNPTVVRVAETVGATPGQVVLAWHLARGAVPVPKAASDARQIENLGALDVTLTPGDVEAITALGRPDGRLHGLDPATYEEF